MPLNLNIGIIYYKCIINFCALVIPIVKYSLVELCIYVLKLNK